VDDAPGFLLNDAPPPDEAVFRPAPVDRRGEGVAWLLSLALAGGLFLLRRLSGGVPWLGLVFLALLVALAALVSIGNWLEARTSIRIDGDGIEERTPLRSVRLAWGEVAELWAWPASLGWRILVRGAGGQILFRTGERMSSPRGAELRLGFPEGERMAAHVRSASRLSLPERQDAGWACRRTAT
jgi:hypothetical protein